MVATDRRLTVTQAQVIGLTSALAGKGGAGEPPEPHAATHAEGGSDPVTVTALAGYPGDTTTFLRADGSFAAPPVGGTPGGSTTQVQFNDGGVFGGDAGLTYDKATDALTVGGNLLFSSDVSVVRTTADGADTGMLSLSGGGSVQAPARGAYLTLYGNEMAAHFNPGGIHLGLGNVASSALHVFNAAGSVTFSIDGATGSLHVYGTGHHYVRGPLTVTGGPLTVLEPNSLTLSYESGLSSLRLLAAGPNDSTPGSIHLVVANTSGGGQSFLQLSATGLLTCPTAYSLTTGTAANLTVDSSGGIRRSTSSRRYKTGIEPLDGWRRLLDLRPVSFQHVNDQVRRVGLIAEDVAAVDPRLAVCGADGQAEEVAYAHLTAPIIQAIQELHARLTALERTIHGAL